MTDRLGAGAGGAMLAALMLAVALPAHAQDTPRIGANEDPRPMRPMDPIDGPGAANRNVEGQFGPSGARVAMARYGACVADHSPDKAGEALLMDFRTPQYRNRMRMLSENNRACFGRRGVMRGSQLLFAGAIAERLLDKGQGPLNVRLARAASAPAIESRSATDAVAICIARSMPDQVAALLQSEVASDGEAAAAAEVEALVPRCWQGNRPLEVTREGLRAMLATATYRSVTPATRAVAAK